MHMQIFIPAPSPPHPMAPFFFPVFGVTQSGFIPIFGGQTAIRRRKGNVTLRDISSGKDLEGVTLHRIAQCEWAHLGSEHVDGGNLTASMALIGGSSVATHPAALVAVDEARSLVLFSIEGDTPTAYRTDEPGPNRVLADLHVLGAGMHPVHLPFIRICSRPLLEYIDLLLHTQ